MRINVYEMVQPVANANGNRAIFQCRNARRNFVVSTIAWFFSLTAAAVYLMFCNMIIYKAKKYTSCAAFISRNSEIYRNSIW